MITWTDTSSDRLDWKFSVYLREFSIIDALTIATTSGQGACLVVQQSALTSIRTHTSGFKCEVGGLLVGRVVRGISDLGEESLLVSVEQSVPSEEYSGTGVSLRMEPSLWSQAEKFLTDNRVVVGWYHSHPNIGAFFSETDRKTQANFFHHSFSIGYVIDPFRNEEKWFQGSQSEEVKEEQIIRYSV